MTIVSHAFILFHICALFDAYLEIDEWHDLCETKKQEKIYLDEDDLCIFAVPSYGGRVPAIALARMRYVYGVQTPAILICVFGNRAYDDTLLEMKKEMQKQGFLPIAAIAAVARHSIIQEYGAGRPDTQDEQELLAYAYKIKESLAQHDKSVVEVPGNVKYREYHGVPLKPKANASCNNCGTCAAACPVQAIPVETPSKTQKDICISCMRCIAICPQHARTLPAPLLTATKWKLASACSKRKDNALFLGTNTKKSH